MENETQIATTEEKKPVKKKEAKGDDASLIIARSCYGQEFEKYDKVTEITDLIIPFKDWYYGMKIKNPNETSSVIIKSYNADYCRPMGRTFFPYNSVYRNWRRKWDLDIMQKMQDNSVDIIPDKQIVQVIKTRNENAYIQDIEDSTLEDGVKTLGGELLNDAFQMLKDDQAMDDIIENDILIKRRNYILNVFGHVTKLVHGKAALMLKASEEKRNNASFLMTLLAQATSGKMTEEQMDMLKGTYKPEGEEPIKVQ